VGQIRVVSYIRVSTEGQANEGFSLDAQERKIAAACIASDLDRVASFVDAGNTARNLARPGLQAALGALTSGQAQGLIVAKLDRLTRRLRDLTGLVDQYFGPYSLISVSDALDTRTAGGRMVLHILGAIAEWESDTISERTKEGMAEGKRQGRRFGPRPLEGPAVARMAALRLSGETLATIALTLAKEGHAPPRGRGWSKETIRQALARRKGTASLP
jgi:site-specific DNA recombinase